MKEKWYENYFREMCAFLDVGYDLGLFRDIIDRRVNSGGIDDILAPVKHYAADKYAGEIGALAGRFGGPAEKWCDQLAPLRSAR